MSDLISRQAAIEEIESHIRTAEEPYYLHDTEKVMNHAFEVAASCVYNLPSAEPEIIRCKDCLIHGVCRFEQGLGLDGYCSQAERRTDE